MITSIEMNKLKSDQKNTRENGWATLFFGGDMSTHDPSSYLSSLGRGCPLSLLKFLVVLKGFDAKWFYNLILLYYIDQCAENDLMFILSMKNNSKF